MRPDPDVTMLTAKEQDQFGPFTGTGSETQPANFPSLPWIPGAFQYGVLHSFLPLFEKLHHATSVQFSLLCTGRNRGGGQAFSLAQWVLKIPSKGSSRDPFCIDSCARIPCVLQDIWGSAFGCSLRFYVASWLSGLLFA